MGRRKTETQTEAQTEHGHEIGNELVDDGIVSEEAPAPTTGKAPAPVAQGKKIVVDEAAEIERELAELREHEPRLPTLRAVHEALALARDERVAVIDREIGDAKAELEKLNTRLYSEIRPRIAVLEKRLADVSKS